MKAGATGYVLKEEAFKELVTAIQTVAQGQPYLSPKIAGIILDDYLPRVENNVDPTQPHMTPREHEVLMLLADGKSTKEIALTLDISVKTVDRHKQQLMEKLGVRGVAELIRYAFQHKMVPGSLVGVLG